MSKGTARHPLLIDRRHDGGVPDPIRFSFDRKVNAAYLRLTQRLEDMTGPTESVSVEAPMGVHGEVILDFRDGRLVGIEVLEADITLPYDLLDSTRP
jgi:uncharacterized protein YuzE